ncbi:molybdenum cofactor biosynthesis prote [Punctularia strigosozonata HHB-11173 SS5]|uniref:molybdenum cofactor biosynthesis prote n=1 Tax=Punctularia strigosozonata (strain HHB-11173) TaxID=741275 RepID=UPI0004416E79|nr:molybdenum cofactor biosynthesis prote [Punctularia strigosozonata HHB-11173 SS5]EIN13885.1 molybdenum cofactor biosynthesis prote [Punctularia strigosozonata HHB-11173 SS5]
MPESAVRHCRSRLISPLPPSRLADALPESFPPLRLGIVDVVTSSSYPHSGRFAVTARASQEVDATSQFSPVLVDNFSRRHNYLRISLTERCNLRCFYCMPNEGVDLSPRSHILDDDEVLRLATLFVKSGVTKIRLTGGEPTVRKGLVDIVGRLNTLRESGLRSIGLTSNGLVLHRQLQDLVANGLTHLNLSLDTLDPFKFEIMTRRPGHAHVLRSLDTALASPGLKAVKLNVVIMKGLNDHEVLDFVELTKDRKLSVRFIEFMPFTGNAWEVDKMVPSSDLLSKIVDSHPTVRKTVDELNDTARSFHVPGYKGSFGFISSMSDHFCSSCNRLRITADGQIKVCLFDAKEISLRDMMRSGASDDQILQAIGLAVKNKAEKHADMEEIDVKTNRPMILIGATEPALTHIDAQGRPSMVNVSSKDPTKRSATACGRIIVPRVAFNLITGSVSDEPLASSEAASLVKAKAKGDTLTVAQLAGIMGSKRTADLIPLCHPLALSHVSVTLTPEAKKEDASGKCPEYSILCSATVSSEGKTGVEMEALTAASVALLTVWDMLKAVAGKEMVITDILVQRKSGGQSGAFTRSV